MIFFTKDVNGRRVVSISTVVAILAIFVAVICLISAGSNQKQFVNQFSFAGTISSIILSVLAIWLSMSGERTMNDIKSRMSDATDRLAGTTTKVEVLYSDYEKTMGSQLEHLNIVQEKISNVLTGMDDVKREIAATHETIESLGAITPATSNNLSQEQAMAIYNNFYNWYSANTKGSIQDQIFCRSVVFVIKSYKNKMQPTLNNLIIVLEQSGIDINNSLRMIDTAWGALNALSSATVFSGEERMNEILKKVENV